MPEKVRKSKYGREHSSSKGRGKERSCAQQQSYRLQPWNFWNIRQLYHGYADGKGIIEFHNCPSTFQKNDANCLIAIEQAQRLKVSPLMVMQNLYVIQGRPSWSSKFLIAAINNSGKFDMELQFEETKDKDGKPYSCLAWTTKNGRRVEGMTVDMEMAKAEGWLGKNGSKWKTMPQLMLRYRAASFFSSLNCPELTMGLYTKEEMQDNDFKEYPMEDLQEQIKRDISENANSEEFVVDAETIDVPESKSAAAEPDSTLQNAEVVDGNDADLPDFLK